MNCEKPWNGKSACTLKIREGCCAIHQNGSGEVQMSEVGYTVSTNSNASGRNTPLVLVYDARGNGGGKVSPTITGEHQNRITDYTATVLKYEETIQQSEE